MPYKVCFDDKLDHSTGQNSLCFTGHEVKKSELGNAVAPIDETAMAAATHKDSRLVVPGVVTVDERDKVPCSAIPLDCRPCTSSKTDKAQ